ncbi:MAG: NAD(P)H-quinone oxidoreductase [Deltaproteobacteria bacterium]|nr:NAD(P)H-quinone oxidoreductase [Deltaproteobacteria bacterium]
MPTKARAIRITEPGGPEVLQLCDLEVADPGPGQVLVEVAAAGINRADLLQRRGLYAAPAGYPADIPGLEYAGVVARVGEGVSRWSPGDRVMGIVGGGGLATHVVVHDREVIAAPKNMELTEVAAIPEVFLTAFDAMFTRGHARMGEWMVIHAAGSGVGIAALQLGQSAGLRCIGTSRTASKLERLRDLGLEHSIVVEGKSFADQVQAITKGGADVILDFIGGAYLGENLKAAAVLGRIVVIGLMGGAKAEMPMGLLLRKRLTMTGTVLRARPLEEKAALAQRFAREAVPLFESGALKPVVDSVMPMADAAEAHSRMEANDTCGKLILRW